MEKDCIIYQSTIVNGTAHPVHTAVLVSFLVSSGYVHLLKDLILDASTKGNDIALSSVTKQKQLYTGPETEWQWQTKTPSGLATNKPDHRDIITLQFDPKSSHIPSTALPEHLSVEPLPPSLDTWLIISDDSHAFSVRLSQVPEFLSLVNEPPIEDPCDRLGNEQQQYTSDKWVQKGEWRKRRCCPGELAQERWAELVHFFNHAALLDIAFMAAAYI
ncbi:N-terminal domain with HPIH motif-domain-containing protein [Aspergillus spectabilis]